MKRSKPEPATPRRKERNERRRRRQQIAKWMETCHGGGVPQRKRKAQLTKKQRAANPYGRQA